MWKYGVLFRFVSANCVPNICAVRNTDGVLQYSVHITESSLFILRSFDLNTTEGARALQTLCIVTFLGFYGISETETYMKLDDGTETRMLNRTQ